MDKNGDGSITLDEYIESWTDMDFDKDKRISPSEWLMKLTYHEKSLCKMYEPSIDWLIKRNNAKAISRHPDCTDWKAKVNELATKFVDHSPEFWADI